MTDTLQPGRDRGWRLLILGSSLLIFCVSASYGFLHGFGASEGSWRGYYTVAVDASLPLAEMDRRLQADGLDRVITAGTALVSLATFTGVGSQAYSQTVAASGTLDPRHDDWIRGMGSFFSDREKRWHIFYLPVDESLVPLMMRLGRIFDPDHTNWKLLEWQPVQGLVLGLGALLAGVLVMAASRGRRLILAFSLVPWLPVAMAGGPVVLGLPVAILVAWSLLLEALVPALLRYAHDVPKAPFFWDRPTDSGFVAECGRLMRPFLDPGNLVVRSLAYILMIAIYAVTAWARGMADLIPGVLVLGLLAWPALVVLLARIYQIRHRRSEHMLFAPVPMLTRKRLFVTSLRPILWPLFGLVLVVSLVGGLAGGAGPAPEVPVPDGKNWGTINYGNALLAQGAGDDGTKPTGGLPDASDLIRHLAFQASLPFLRDHDWQDFRLPAKGKSLTLDVFTLNGSQVSVAPEERIRFGDAWLGAIIHGLPSISVERMMLDQGRISGLVFASAGTVSSADIWIVPALAGLVILVLPFWLAGRNPGFRQLYGSSRTTAWGRKAAA